MNESIKIDVKVGDTILTGKFKNKKTVIKSIGTDEHGMPTINGRKACNFRIAKKEKTVKESLIRKLIRKELLKEDMFDDLANIVKPVKLQLDVKILKAVLDDFLGELGTLDANDYKNMHRYVMKKDPEMTLDKLIHIVVKVGKESTIGSKTLKGTDEEIKNEIESYYGI